MESGFLVLPLCDMGAQSSPAGTGWWPPSEHLRAVVHFPPHAEVTWHWGETAHVDTRGLGCRAVDGSRACPGASSPKALGWLVAVVPLSAVHPRDGFYCGKPP